VTKKEAAAHLFFVAKLIREEMEGDDEADMWIMLVESIAHDLDPRNPRYVETYLRERRISRRLRIRRLIEHPLTPPHEREAAVRALHRIAHPTKQAATTGEDAQGGER
jgi:hypothetical protein